MNTGVEAPDIDVTAAQRQVGANAEVIANFSAPRVNLGVSDASFSWGTHALRPAPSAGLAGDRYYETDRNWVYYHSGTVWLFLAGLNVGTDATRAAITVTANDNGAEFFTSDTGKLWRVEGGAWVDKFVTLTLTTSLKIGTLQVIAARKTGWGSPSGTLSRAAYAAYAGQTVSSPPTQAEMQALDDAVKLMSQTLAALLTDFHSATSGHGAIGP